MSKTVIFTKVESVQTPCKTVGSEVWYINKWIADQVKKGLTNENKMELKKKSEVEIRQDFGDGQIGITLLKYEIVEDEAHVRIKPSDSAS